MLDIDPLHASVLVVRKATFDEQDRVSLQRTVVLYSERKTPQTSAGRPLGNPPYVISSSPRMPVGLFGNSRGDIFRVFKVCKRNRTPKDPQSKLFWTELLRLARLVCAVQVFR